MVTINNAINDTVGASNSGATNTFTVTNSSNTASSAARETVTVGGSSAGDATLNFNVNGATDWETGIDNSDSDKYKISLGTTLGTNDTLVLLTAGEVLKPRSPAFLAVVSATQSNVTGNGTLYTIINDTAVQNIGSNYNTGTGLFTASAAGTYFFTATVNMGGLNAAHVGGSFFFILNGATFYVGQTGSPVNQGDPAGDLSWVASNTLPLSAGDTVGVVLGVSGGAKVVSIFGTAIGNPVTSFSGFLVG